MRDDVGVNEKKLAIENGRQHDSFPKTMKSRTLTRKNITPGGATRLAALIAFSKGNSAPSAMLVIVYDRFRV